MNIDWMRQKLEAFVMLCERYNLAGGPDGDALLMRQIRDDIADALPTVKEIILRLDENLLIPAVKTGFVKPPFGLPDQFGGMRESELITRMALGVLRDREELKVNLAPDSPSLTADEFHPTVWKAAADVWDTGEYKMAAQAACISLSAHIKEKAGSPPLNERALVAQVFSTEDPKPGQSKLHFPGNHADENWKSRQQGLHLLAQGAFAGIRNIATHDAAAWTEHEALEHLAVLSVVARWADETALVSV